MDSPANPNLAETKSPLKSVAFPVEDIVIKSIIFVFGASPPANKPRVDDETAAKPCLVVTKSPKSIAFPVVEIVT